MGASTPAGPALVCRAARADGRRTSLRRATGRSESQAARERRGLAGGGATRSAWMPDRAGPGAPGPRRRGRRSARRRSAGPRATAGRRHRHVANDPSLALAIQTADCVPLLIADRVTGAVAAAHAGWRGLAAGVPGVAGRARWRASSAARRRTSIAAIGPSICAERYEVGDDVRARFVDGGLRSGAARALVLCPARVRITGCSTAGAAASDQLEAAGLAPTDPRRGLCTARYPDLFCSYRRDGKGAGRIAAAISARR